MKNQLKVEDLVIGELYKVKMPDEIIMEGAYQPELWDVAKLDNYDDELGSLRFSNPKSGETICELFDYELLENINEYRNQ